MRGSYPEPALFQTGPCVQPQEVVMLGVSVPLDVLVVLSPWIALGVWWLVSE